MPKRRSTRAFYASCSAGLPLLRTPSASDSVSCCAVMSCSSVIDTRFAPGRKKMSVAIALFSRRYLVEVYNEALERKGGIE